MNRPLIAILDDEPDIVELVTLNLENANFRANGFTNVNTLYAFLDKETPALLVLDLMLPGADGFEICRDLRKGSKHKSLPIIMLTARGDEVDKVLGLELGADDYVTKPFSPRELVSRVRAVLRRGNVDDDETVVRMYGDIEMDLLRYTTKVRGDTIPLTATEFNLLDILSRKPGWVYSREQLLNHLWGNEKIVIDRTIDVHIRHLREKLGTAGDIIKNIRGVGYKIEL